MKTTSSRGSSGGVEMDVLSLTTGSPVKVVDRPPLLQPGGTPPARRRLATHVESTGAKDTILELFHNRLLAPVRAQGHEKMTLGLKHNSPSYEYFDGVFLCALADFIEEVLDPTGGKKDDGAIAQQSARLKEALKACIRYLHSQSLHTGDHWLPMELLDNPGVLDAVIDGLTFFLKNLTEAETRQFLGVLQNDLPKALLGEVDVQGLSKISSGGLGLILGILKNLTFPDMLPRAVAVLTGDRTVVRCASEAEASEPPSEVFQSALETAMQLMTSIGHTFLQMEGVKVRYAEGKKQNETVILCPNGCAQCLAPLNPQAQFYVGGSAVEPIGETRGLSSAETWLSKAFVFFQSNARTLEEAKAKTATMAQVTTLWLKNLQALAEQSPEVREYLKRYNCLKISLLQTNELVLELVDAAGNKCPDPLFQCPLKFTDTGAYEHTATSIFGQLPLFELANMALREENFPLMAMLLGMGPDVVGAMLTQRKEPHDAQLHAKAQAWIPCRELWVQMLPVLRKMTARQALQPADYELVLKCLTDPRFGEQVRPLVVQLVRRLAVAYGQNSPLLQSIFNIIKQNLPETHRALFDQAVGVLLKREDAGALVNLVDAGLGFLTQRTRAGEPLAHLLETCVSAAVEGGAKNVVAQLLHPDLRECVVGVEPRAAEAAATAAEQEPKPQKSLKSRLLELFFKPEFVQAHFSEEEREQDVTGTDAPKRGLRTAGWIFLAVVTFPMWLPIAAFGLALVAMASFTQKMATKFIGKKLEIPREHLNKILSVWKQMALSDRQLLLRAAAQILGLGENSVLAKGFTFTIDRILSAGERPAQTQAAILQPDDVAWLVQESRTILEAKPENRPALIKNLVQSLSEHKDSVKRYLQLLQPIVPAVKDLAPDIIPLFHDTLAEALNPETEALVMFLLMNPMVWDAMPELLSALREGADDVFGLWPLLMPVAAEGVEAKIKIDKVLEYVAQHPALLQGAHTVVGVARRMLGAQGVQAYMESLYGKILSPEVLALVQQQGSLVKLLDGVLAFAERWTEASGGEANKEALLREMIAAVGACLRPGEGNVTAGLSSVLEVLARVRPIREVHTLMEPDTAMPEPLGEVPVARAVPIVVPAKTVQTVRVGLTEYVGVDVRLTPLLSTWRVADVQEVASSNPNDFQRARRQYFQGKSDKEGADMCHVLAQGFGGSKDDRKRAVVVVNALADALDAWRQADDPAARALWARGIQTLQFVFHEEGVLHKKRTVEIVPIPFGGPLLGEDGAPLVLPRLHLELGA